MLPQLMYFCRQDTKVYSGVGNKIHLQIKALSNDFDVSLLELSDDNEIILKNAGQSRILWRGKNQSPGFLGQKWNRARATKQFNRITLQMMREGGFDLLFLRFNRMDCSLLNLLRHVAKHGRKTIIEIPTYPYLTEIRKMPCPINVYWIIMDALCRPFTHRYVDAVVTCSPVKQIFGINTVFMPNGYDFSELALRKIRIPDGTIQLLAVAVFQAWHAYERIIQGMANYLAAGGDAKIILHFVGDGPELKMYKSLVAVNHLENYVVFHGTLDKDGIFAIASKCDIALESLGCHRKNIFMSSSLKSREYAAMGFPIITSVDIDIWEGTEPFILRVPGDDSPVDMSTVVQFYHSIYDGGQEETLAMCRGIRDSAAERCDISATYSRLCDVAHDVLNAQ